MGDISAEPSMEEILSSIKRIIAEEGDAAASSPRSRRAAAKAGPKADPVGRDEILELSDPVDEDDAPRARMSSARPAPEPPAPEPSVDAEPEEAPVPAEAAPESRPSAETILSQRAAEASRGQLEALSRMVLKPQTPGAETLEGLVREMLKPMLSDWLDANLPSIVEALVAKEIARISGRDA